MEANFHVSTVILCEFWKKEGLPGRRPLKLVLKQMKMQERVQKIDLFYFRCLSGLYLIIEKEKDEFSFCTFLENSLFFIHIYRSGRRISLGKGWHLTRL